MLRKHIPNKIKWLKKLIMRLLLFVLGRAFQSVALHDKDVKNEVANWNEGFSLMMKVLPNGPFMRLEKIDGKIKYTGTKIKKANLEIYMRNAESAFLILTPQLSAHQAFAEKRMSIKGNLAKVMSYTRCLNIVLNYLYPNFIVKNLIKKLPKTTLKKRLLIIWLYTFGIITGK